MAGSVFVGSVLAVCDSADQVEYLLQLESVPPVDIYVATRSDAAWAFEKNNITYRVPEDFYDEPTLYASADTVAKTQFEWVRWVDKHIQGLNPTFHQFGFCPASYHMFSLRVLTDILLVHAFVMDQLLLACQPSIVISFDDPIVHKIDRSLLFQGGIYTDLLRVYSEFRHFEFHCFKMPQKHEPKQATHLRGFLPELLRYKLGHFKKYGFAGLKRIVTADFTNTLILSDTYDIDGVARLADQQQVVWQTWHTLKRRIMRCASHTVFPVSNWKEKWSNIVSEPQFLRPFSFQNVDLWGVVSTRLEYWWQMLIPQSWGYLVAAQEILSKSCPKAVMLPFVGEEGSAEVCQVAKSLGVPSVIYQHGGFVGHCEDNAWDFRDLPHSDYLFVFGAETAGYFNQRPAPPGFSFSHAIAVGSSRLDKISVQKEGALLKRNMLNHQGKSIVLYYSNPDKMHKRYLNRFCLSSLGQYRVQKSLFDLFNEFSDYHFVYKMHPVHHLVEGELAQQLCPSCEVIGSELSLTDLVFCADLIIADHPSTGILEAALTDKEIVVYIEESVINLTNSGRELFQKRATLVESLDEMLNELRKMFTKGDFKSNKCHDLSFQKGFATHLGDGLSAQRALDCLQSLSEKSH